MKKCITKKTKNETKIEKCPKCKVDLAQGIYSKLITIIHGASFDMKKVEPVIGADIDDDGDELLSLCFHCANCGEKLGYVGMKIGCPK